MADTEGFEEFYTATVGRLLGQLFPVTGDLHQAEEVVEQGSRATKPRDPDASGERQVAREPCSEAYARASVRWGRLRDYDVPEAWVRRVAMNLAADRGRRLQRQAHAIRRGRQRRRRIAGGIASLLLVAVVAGAAGTGQLGNQPSRPVTPATTPPPAPDLQVRTDKPRPGSLEESAFQQLTSELRRCPGGSSIPADLIGYVWSERYQRLWMVAAKQPPTRETRFCWTSGLFDATGNGSRWGARRVASLTTPLTSLGGASDSGSWEIEGRVSKEATRLQLRFRDGREGWAAHTLTAFDAAGRTVTGCRVGPPVDGTPKCPGN